MRLATIFILIFLSCDGITLRGMLTVRGNEPHTRLVLTTDTAEEYSLSGPIARDLYRYQYRKVTVRGTITSEAAGPGFPATLEVTKLLSVGSP